MSSGPKPVRFRLLLIAVSLLVLMFGAVEDWYGNTDDGDVYGSDAVQYLDIARAMERGDWHSALNPLWSQGYPAILATVRPAFAAGPGGDWTTTRVVNLGIFALNYGAFLYLFFGLLGEEPVDERRATLAGLAGVSVFLSTQVCLGQVSRVNPDELVTTFFFLVCGFLVRLSKRDRLIVPALVLGLALGVGFLVKAVYLALGCGVLGLWGLSLWHSRRRLLPAALAFCVFAGIAGSYGVALSSAMGRPSLGEAGALNYAWHVNRLAKWVHWEGGVDPADKAWPKPWIARFAEWETKPPEFGTPIHPSRILRQSPLIYGFAAPMHATYTPYYNPAYWYEGYRRFVNPRYQLIAVAKSLGDLAKVFVTQPIFLFVALAALLLLGSGQERARFAAWVQQRWVIVAASVLGVCIYVPVHLEGRYLASFLATVAIVVSLGAVQASELRQDLRWRGAVALLLLGTAAELAMYQRPVWQNMFAHKAPERNVEWQVAEAVLQQHLPEMSQVGVIAWTANLHCDWAYMAHLQITSEIANKADDDGFWQMSPAAQQDTLATFRQAGAVAVFSRDKPRDAVAPGWQRLGETPMWMYRIR